MNIQELKTAGFSEEEIGEYVSGKRNALLQAGFTDFEINDYYGIDSNAPEFKDMPDSNAVSERTGQIWDKGQELNIPTDTVRENYDDIFPDPADVTLQKSPDEKEEFVPMEFRLEPEHDDLAGKIFGYESSAKPEDYWSMNPIKRAAFDVYMATGHLLTRTGGMAVRTMGLANDKDVLDLYNEEMVDNPKWYQNSPEVLGWGIEQAAEFYAMKGLWNVTRLGKLFGWGRTATTKLVAPFLWRELTVRGGTEVLPTLSREGLKQLGKDATISFLKNAPENIAFLETWMVGKAALTGEDKSEAAWSGLLWSGGFSIFTPAAGASSKIFMATSVGEKIKTVAQEAYKELWINFPRMMNAGRKPFSDEYFAAARKWFKNQFGYYPNPAEEAQLKEMTRRVGKKVTEAAEKNAATNAYWNSGKEAAKTVVEEEVAVQQAAKTPAPEGEVKRSKGYEKKLAERRTGFAEEAKGASTEKLTEALRQIGEPPSWPTDGINLMRKQAIESELSRRQEGVSPAEAERDNYGGVLIDTNPTPPAPATTPTAAKAEAVTPASGEGKTDPASTGTGEGVKGKEPWEMTREEFLAEAKKQYEAVTPIRQNATYKTVISEETGKPVQVPTKYTPAKNVVDEHPVAMFEQGRKLIIKKALAEGKPVPPEVLADYPDLQKPSPTKTELSWDMTLPIASDIKEKITARLDEISQVYDLSGIKKVQVIPSGKSARMNGITDVLEIPQDIGDWQNFAQAIDHEIGHHLSPDFFSRSGSPTPKGKEFDNWFKKNKKQIASELGQYYTSGKHEAAAELIAKSIAGDIKPWMQEGINILIPPSPTETGQVIEKIAGKATTPAADIAPQAKGEADLIAEGKPETIAQKAVDEHIGNIKKPKRVRGKLEPGMIDVSGVTEAVKEVIDNGVGYVKKTYETGKDLIDAFQFYPNVPLALRNAIRIDIIGAGNQAGHRIYGGLSPKLLGGMTREDIEKSARIFYAKDEIARTKAGKGNPNLTIEDAQANYDELIKEASPTVLSTVENLAKIQKAYTDVLIKRGLLDPNALLDDYARHYVHDYTPDWAFRRGLPPLKLRTPFRGYTKEATGTKKEYARTMESILFSFYEKELDNIVADFIEEQTAKYNILPKLSKAQKVTLFGANARGTPNKPNPGRIVEVGGKRYKSFSPDAPFTRTSYRTENGERVMGGLKHISLIPEDIADCFNSFSQRGGPLIAKINQVTRFWKSMAILSRYIGFNLNNIVGDTYAAITQYPEPMKLLAEYTTVLRYLTGKGEGQFYKDLDAFITKHDVVKGMLTTTELANLGNSDNPLWIIMDKLQKFSETREAFNRVAYAACLLRKQQAGQGAEMVKAHDWIDTEGLDEMSALGKIARDVQVDYKWVGPYWARYVSGFAVPFGTWPFKMSANIWRWMSKHWGKALVTFLAAPVAATFYNDRSKESRDIEKSLPDGMRNSVHFNFGRNPDGTSAVLRLQLPQDALIGTKIFTIATSYVNRVALGEMTAKEAAIAALKNWGYKETAGMASMMGAPFRFIYGLASKEREDPYDKSPIYSKDPKELTAWEHRWQTGQYFLKCAIPFLSASIQAAEKGLPQDMGWRQALDNLVGKSALGIYNVTLKNEVVKILDDGRQITLSWDDNAKIEWINQEVESRLDKVEDSYVAAGKSPNEYYKSAEGQGKILKIHRFWEKFEPELNSNLDDKGKVDFVVNTLGERLMNRFYSSGTLSKWYKVNIDRAKTDEEKTRLGKEHQRLLKFKIDEAIKIQPKVSRQTYFSLKLKDSDIPTELLWQMPN